MHAIDTFLIAKLDAAANWYQRKGGCLAAAHFFAVIVFVAAMLVTGTSAMIVKIVIGGIQLAFGTLNYYCLERGYQDSIKQTQQLNARVIAHRDDNYKLRMIALFLTLFFSGPALAALDFAWFTGNVFLFLVVYGDHCFFLGPGEHGRDRFHLFSHKLANQGAQP